MNRCPICNRFVDKVWESSGTPIHGGAWWTGRYVCGSCGRFHASGTERDGERITVQWTPGCPDHGPDPVHLVDQDPAGCDVEWACSICHRKIRVQNGELVIRWKPYEPMFIDYGQLFINKERLGGLPHD